MGELLHPHQQRRLGGSLAQHVRRDVPQFSSERRAHHHASASPTVHQGTSEGHVAPVTQEGIRLQHLVRIFQYRQGLTGEQGFVRLQIMAGK